jgi:putative transposase
MNKERKHIRLRNYVYSSNGMYFITICVKNRENLFGEILKDEMILNETGNIAEKYLNQIPDDIPTQGNV